MPVGTVTFLFTDIEGSTRLLHQLGDHYAVVLADHRGLLREAFARHEGVEVDTQGDSFFVAFADPSKALAAAADAQTALARHAWPNGAAVRVRMGLHTGDPLVADGHYVGVDVHRGARIAAAAHGGQTLVSETTRALVAFDSDAFRDVGAYRLKDLPEPERLYQFVIEGLPSSFPPPRVHEEALAAAGLPDYSLPPADVPCPYKGLIAFEPDDAELFFGREQLVDDLERRLQDAAFLAVVGASGSGKSSLVRAGLVPKLMRRDEALRPALFSPGEHPLAGLASAHDARLLVVDQFEEVFTLCRDDQERRAFIDALLDKAQRGVRVVLALRADFYGHCAVYPRLAAALEDHQALVGPMSEEELRRAIERPADHAGLLLEPGLVEGILRDVVGEPGALPLLSHNLLETWKRRSGRMLTLIGYLQAGGVQGAIAKTAETVYHEALTPQQQTLARNIFLRLTELGEGTEDTRRRVTIAEITPRAEQRDDVDEVLRKLADARLVTIGEGTVEVAHEALIRHWPTLRAWLDEDREGRLIHRRLTEAAQEWNATARDRALLFRGTRLAGASDWGVTHDSELNELEREFLSASRDAELDEIKSTRKRNRRLRALLVGTGAALVVAIVAGLLALNQRNTARATALTADAQRVGAEALTVDRLDRALLLARTGVALEETVRTRGNLLAVLMRVPPAVIGFLGGTADAEIYTAAISPDGSMLAIGDAPGVVTTFDTSSRRKLGEYRIGEAIGEGLVQTLTFSPDGGMIAVVGRPTFTNPALVVDLLDARTLERSHRVELPPLQDPVDFLIATPIFGPDGRDALVLQGNPDGLARSELWRVDVDSGDIEGPPVRVGGSALDIFPARTGKRVFVTSPDDDVTHEIDAESLRLVRRHAIGGMAGALSPHGSALAVGSRGGSIRFLNLRSGSVRLFARAHRVDVLDMAFTPDGRTLVSSDADGGVIAWDVARGEVSEELSLHLGPVGAVVISPDGRTLYSAGDDGRLILWDLAGDRRLARSFSLRQKFEDIQTPRGIAVSPNGKTLAVTEGGGAVDLIDTATLQKRGSVQAAPDYAAAVAFSPDGDLLAVSGGRGSVTLWDAQTLSPAGTLKGLSGELQTIAFSPDGNSLAAAEVIPNPAHLVVWSVRRRAVTVQTDTGNITSLAFSPDGRLIALSALDGGTEIRNAQSGKLVRRIPAEGLARSVAFSPDGRLLAVGTFDNDAQLYSTETWRPVGRRLEGHSDRVTNVVFSGDGRTLATSSGDGTVLLWDVKTQERIGAPLAVEPGALVSVALHPDGSHLFAVSTELSGVRLAIDLEVWKRHACLIAGRELTAREWRDALPERPYQTVCPND